MWTLFDEYSYSVLPNGNAARLHICVCVHARFICICTCNTSMCIHVTDHYVVCWSLTSLCHSKHLKMAFTNMT